MHSMIEELWDEWSACPGDEAPLVEAECGGLLSGLLTARGDRLVLGTARLWLARRLLKLWRRTSWFDAGWNIADAVTLPAESGGRVRIRIPIEFRGELLALAAGLSNDGLPLSSRHWAWLRGLWGSCGGLYLPRTGYYLVPRVALDPVAEALRALLRRTDLPWRERPFRGAREMLLRNQEGIVTFLCNLGLSAISLQLENKAIIRSMRNQANRERNCDTVNIKRHLRVAAEQMELALAVSGAGLLPGLPPLMRRIVEVRLANPEASLSELGEKLSPPVTKSTVKYHWNRLHDYATSLPSRTWGPPGDGDIKTSSIGS